MVGSLFGRTGNLSRVALPDLIPIDVLFGNADRSDPRISPDGSKLAFLAPDEGVVNVWVADIDGSNAQPVTKDRKRGIQPNGYEWAYDGRHILFIQDKGGDENWHVWTVDLDTGETIDRTPFDGVQADYVGGLSPRKPDEVLVHINRDDARYHDVYRLDLASGDLTKVATNEGFASWLIDHDLVVRGAVRPTEDGGNEVLLGENGDWTVAFATSGEDYLINLTMTIGFSGDGRRLFHTTAAGSNTTRLVAYDLETKATMTLAEDPDYDVMSYVIGAWGMLHPTTQEPQLAPVYTDRQTYIVIDKDLEADIRALEVLGNGDVQILGRDLADEKWIVAFVPDDRAVQYHLYERASKKTKLLFTGRPELERYELATMEPISFAASDGLRVRGYLTFPPGVEQRDLPAVLHVHGGPWGGRHFRGYQPINQWIANRGYACIEVDFRGSGGYGKAFLNASAREWAGAMHTDLLDALDHCVSNGWIDPDRVAIFGGSYGGYAALVGATFTPDVFRCAIDYVGPSNLITLLESIPPYWFAIAKQFDKLLGDPKKDREFLWERSPLSRVDDIRIPVLIAQGANDPRVKQAESEQIVEALAQRGLEYEYLLFEDEGHGFVRPENRERFHLASERFLSKHLGGRAQDSP